jgi:hypothetical protein
MDKKPQIGGKDTMDNYVHFEGKQKPAVRIEPQMMICPKAKECTTNCKHSEGKKPHECEDSCRVASFDCPICIPYVAPSPARCEHEWHPITQGTWNCTKCGEPYYDKQEEKNPHLTGVDVGIPDASELYPDKPEPMPLIELPDEIIGMSRTHFMNGAKKQRDADIAWHKEKVKQVRREFAEECIKKIGELFEDTKELVGLPAVKNFIRAMADKE